MARALENRFPKENCARSLRMAIDNRRGYRKTHSQKSAQKNFALTRRCRFTKAGGALKSQSCSSPEA
jgi:hypothetical protein